MKKRILSLLLVLVMVFNFMPTLALANTGSTISVQVIVENTTKTEAAGAPWTGQLFDTAVEVPSDANAIEALQKALEVNNYTDNEISSNYISKINGLAEDNLTYAGWMGTLNDWFTSSSLDSYTLEDGDVIKIMYSQNFGSDIGSDYSSHDKTLKDLEFSKGTLYKADGSEGFAKGSKEYNLVVGSEPVNLTVTPTATNKNFQVRTYKGTVYSAADAGYKRTSSISVKSGDTILVVVGDPAWPSMSNGEYGCNAENYPAEVYTINVVDQKPEAPADPVSAFFSKLDGIATWENDADYPMVVDETENALVSTNKAGYSVAGITLTFSKTAELSFDYKASSELTWDFLKISKNSTALNDSYSQKSDFSGNMTEYKKYTIQVNAGDVIKLEYSKDSSGDSNSDCVWLKNFTASLPYSVTFHANDGTDTTTEQGIFGSANLNGNTFAREGYVFDGWAESANGEIAYTDGEKITLTENIDLYAVWTAVYPVTFPNMPDGTAIVVKDAEGNEIDAESDGSYILRNGNYTFSADLFGYINIKDQPFTVNGAGLAVGTGLVEAARYSVSFNVAPAEATPVIVLKNSLGEEITAVDGVYSLPSGDYTYTITAAGYMPVKEQPFTVGGENQIIPVTLEVSYIWDGSAQEPACIDGVYQIDSGEKLAWFAAAVNGGNTDINAVLTKNIMLNGDEKNNAWTSIGTSDNGFAGKFDGNGKTVSGLYQNDSAAKLCGLFGKIAVGGQVQNLTLDAGQITTQNSTTPSSNTLIGVGLIAGYNDGTVENCAVKNSAVNGAIAVGGIVGYNKGSVSGCANESAVVTQNIAKDQGIGGIVGQNEGTVKLCYSHANIVRGHSSNNYGYAGGIVGLNNGTVENVYSACNIDTFYYCGSIIGNHKGGKLENAYSTGTLEKSGAGICGSGSGTLSNCYYLEGTITSAKNGTVKTSAELQALAQDLGGSFEADLIPNINSGYPILKWQNPNATYSITLNVVPDNATVILKKGEAVIEATSSSDGTFVYNGLDKGDYTYTVNGIAADDYAPQTETISLATSDVTKDITLQANTYKYIFTGIPENGTLTVKKGDAVMEAEADGSYRLANGDYTYNVTAFGYDDVSGNFTVNRGGDTIAVNMNAQSKNKLTFTVDQPGAIITVSHATGGVQIAESYGSYNLIDGEYSYTVKLKGYKTAKGTVTMAGAEQNIPINLVVSVGWEGDVETAFAGGDGTQENPYLIENGEQLAYLSQLIADRNSQYSNKYYKVTDDINMGGTAAFTPIGTSSSTAFSGHFDGDNHIISNLKVDTENNYGGLFGYIKSAEIKNVVLTNASVTANQYTGGLIGYSAYSKINNCAVIDADVNGSYYVGGLAGYIGYTDITECSAVAKVVGSSTDYGYAGGLIGQAAGSSNVTYCFARGSVAANQKYAGGLLGYYSGSTFKYSYADVDVNSKGTNYGYVTGSGALYSNYNIIYNADRTCTGSGSAYTSAYYTAKNTAELKSGAVVDLLNTNGEKYALQSTEAVITNEGYPYLINTYAVTIHPVTLAKVTNVAWDGETATWNAVENAQSYKVTLYKDNDSQPVQTFETEELSYDLSTALTFSGSGSYTFAVQAMGDGLQYKNGPLSDLSAGYIKTVNGADVTFTITLPEGCDYYPDGEPIITLEGNNNTVTIAKDVASFLPNGNYTYTIKTKGYETITGQLTVNDTAKNIRETLTKMVTWDGNFAIEPITDGDDTYLIATGPELAWFAAKVNEQISNGSSGSNLNAKLIADINLGNHQWTPIGIATLQTGSTYKFNPGYQGTFDGNNKTVSGLKIDDEAANNQGLFGYVTGSAVIKDLTVSGSINAKQYVGGIVGQIQGNVTITNCINNAVISTVHSGNAMTGGIIGALNSNSTNAIVEYCTNNGQINGAASSCYMGGIIGNASYGQYVKNCKNNGNVVGGGNSDNIGGIVGNCTIPITCCHNQGNVSGKVVIGGIAGFVNKAISNCYNSGNVGGLVTISGTSGSSSGVGGIVGRLHSVYGGRVDSCYNTGSITAEEGTPGAITGYNGNATVNATTNSYYLEGTAATGIGIDGNENDVAEAKTEAEMKSMAMAGILGGQFAGLENQYPVLKWENENAQYVCYIETDPKDAVVALSNGNSALNAVENGVYALTENGAYSYSVSKNGYDTVNGTVEFNAASTYIKVVLNAETFDVSFNVTPADAQIIVKNSDNQVVNSVDGVYKLPRGQYTYQISKFGYISADGSFAVTNGAVEIPAITLQTAQTYPVTFNITPADAPDLTITVKFNNQVINGANNLYNLPDGEYEYLITASGYFNAGGKLKVNGAAQTVPIQLETRTTWDGTTAEGANNIDGVYQICNAEELSWFAQQVNAGHTDYKAKLVTDIFINDELSSNNWVSIGTYSNQFAGSFDGNGKTVYGLKGETDSASLFGFLAAGSVVKDVTVTGEINGSSNVGAIARSSYGTISNCKNYADINGTGQRVGGIVGVSYESSAISNCANYGKISSSYSGTEYTDSGTVYLGGITGYAYCNISNCVNAGEVVSSAANYGGVGGIAGAANKQVLNCYNTASVTGPKRLGGITGLSNYSSAALIENCYSIGAITATGSSANNFVGAITGSVNNSSGVTVGTVNNCYYLENAAASGIGYGTDSTAAKTAAEMQADNFVTLLGAGFNADSVPNINNGYPVVAWQGGREVISDDDLAAVAADKAALILPNTRIKAPGSLNLPDKGENGSDISWSSDNQDVISNSGIVTLPASNKVTVNLTATISKGNAKETKNFEIEVWSQTEIDQAYLAEAVNYLGSAPIRPVYGTDSNVVTMIESRLAADYADITVSLTDPVNTDYIADDGAITYFYQDPSQNMLNFANVYGVKFALSKGSSSADYTANAIIGWDGAKVAQWLNANIVPELTFDKLKGENTSADSVTKNLSLPTSVGCTTVNWEAVKGGVAVSIEPDSNPLNPTVCRLTPAEDDTDVQLKAVIVFNKTSDGEPEISVESNLDFTVTGKANIDYKPAMREILDSKYTVDKLKYAISGDVINPQSLTDDFLLLKYKDLGITVNDYTLAVSSDNTDVIEISGYRANVYRSLEQEQTATLTVTLTHKASGQQVTKDLTFTVSRLTQAEIDKGLALMDKVKDAYFDGIKDTNTAPDNITADLHGFREACDDGSGGLTWIYNYADDKYTGIRVTDIPKAGYDESYNLYHSSNPNIIAHETLQLQSVPATNQDITITSQLCYAPLADYAAKYPNNADLQKLAGTPVSITVKVRGNSEDQVAANKVYDKIAEIGEVTLESKTAIDAARSAYDNLNQVQKALVDNADVLTAAEKSYQQLQSTVLQGIEIETAPDKVSYYVGDTFNPSGLVINKVMLDGSKQEVIYNDETKGDFTFSPSLDTKLTATDSIVTITYGEQSATQEIKVSERNTNGGGPGVKQFTLKFETNGGSAIASVTKTENSKINLADYTPTRQGYTFEGWYSDRELKKPITVVTLAADITVYAKWTEIQQPVGKYIDVIDGAWYVEAIDYVDQNNIMQGVGNQLFAPNDNTSRAMVAQILYNMEGKPEVSGGTAFTDVAENAWYTDAIIWAVQNNIAEGNGAAIFAPNDNVTREQLAKLLYGYAKFKGYNTDLDSLGIEKMSDYGQISDWALESMTWAYNAKVIQGKTSELLDPQGSATRAEIAQMIMNFQLSYK